ncbi:chemotaxis protein methyltransferase CheR [Thermosulfidibacter takaii ABI70S6]|uniref:Chemotaxis protein methyltransferase CheR n=1 Tax=Thermosulfidibacter takaii (strain DSM 17441 / JCM 13301 / NBRC 103674 / ABI70S6) TaxID=1298851 RepID=A0A0S3QT65_THET7|nr:protein-glutamate O-methyltransferase CheR [Thermosulfidibacter takaii]BAT71473.1 chemotaxis protein methyltransferase CheR [Thermosulfidibacter takaii ABI70S6]
MGISTDTIKKVANVIYNELGIVVDSNNERILGSKISTFLLRKRITEQELLSKLTDRNFFKELISIITVNETYFFREKEHIDLLVKLIKKNRSVRARILSLPCSTGEEPLSILMACLEAGVKIDNIDIIGVDVDENAIAIAKDGVYSYRSVSKVPESLKAKYFVSINGAYKVREDLIRKVSYRVGNIFDKSFLRSLGMFDFIFCRNLLIYFDRVKREEALKNISLIHKTGGYLFISKTETLLGLNVPYKREFIDGIIVYKRL